MILDEIIAFFALLLVPLFEGTVLIGVLTVNFFAFCIEAVVGIFITGFSLGRLRKKEKPESKLAVVLRVLPLCIFLALICWLLVLPKVLNREVTLVAEDGHSLPFAAMIVHTKGGDDHQRTDSSGNITVPRFSLTGMTIKDARYMEKTWSKSEIKSELVVSRTILGAGLDSLAERLLRKAKQ